MPMAHSKNDRRHERRNRHQRQNDRIQRAPEPAAQRGVTTAGVDVLAPA
jgi:hypothetical protein